MSIKSEAKTRFYDPNTLQIVTSVERSKPKKIKDEAGNVIQTLTHRDPTITDARKADNMWLPSVTSIIKSTIAAPQLVRWIENDSIKMSAEYPYAGDGSVDDIEDRYLPMIRGKRKEYANTVQELGKAMHKDKERYFMEGVEPETIEGANVVIGYKDFMLENGADPENLTCEQAFGSKEIGYAGTPDDYMSDVNYIIDLKTTKHKNFETIKKASDCYTSWKLQLGAYRITAPSARLWQCVASQETGETKFIELEKPDAWAQAFQHTFEIWCIVNNHDPRKG